MRLAPFDWRRSETESQSGQRPARRALSRQRPIDVLPAVWRTRRQTTLGLGAPQIGVRSVEPVLSRWAEDVHIERRLERLCLVRQVRRNMENRARGDVDDL